MGVDVSIDLAGLGVSSKYTERICVMFTEPAVFIHGTRAELREFARQIIAKTEPTGCAVEVQ